MIYYIECNNWVSPHYVPSSFVLDYIHEIILCYTAWVQRWGFSPVWVIMCVFRWFGFENFLIHSVQGYNFCSSLLWVWVFWWSLSLPSSQKDLPHREQKKGLYPEWILVCSVRPDEIAKDLPHCGTKKVYLQCGLLYVSSNVLTE